MVGLIPGVYQIPQGHVAIAQCWGKFSHVLEPGLNFVNPFTSNVKDLTDWGGIASKQGYLLETTEQQQETEERKCQTGDGLTVYTTAVIYYKIVDPKKAVYQIDLLPKSIQNVCLQVLRSKVSEYNYNELVSKRIAISEEITKELASRVSEWGVSLKSVEVGQLACDHDFETALKEKRVAEAKKAASIVNLEIEKQQSEAEAMRKKNTAAVDLEIQKAKVEAAAEAEKIGAVAKAEVAVMIAQANAKAQMAQNDTAVDLVNKVGANVASEILRVNQVVSALKAFAENDHNKTVMLPSDLRGFLNLDITPVRQAGSV